jgi:3-deoxy-D-manno-octulosonate 8-phosphate phosphatase KdsC-like HAD superfamily phosphatase
MGHPSKIKIKVKGSGQECPIHTSMSTKVGSTFVDFTFSRIACESGISSENCAAIGGRVFRWGVMRTAGPSLAPSLALRLARDDKCEWWFVHGGVA